MKRSIGGIAGESFVVRCRARQKELWNKLATSHVMDLGHVARCLLTTWARKGGPSVYYEYNIATRSRLTPRQRHVWRRLCKLYERNPRIFAVGASAGSIARMVSGASEFEVREALRIGVAFGWARSWRNECNHTAYWLNTGLRVPRSMMRKPENEEQFAAFLKDVHADKWPGTGGP